MSCRFCHRTLETERKGQPLPKEFLTCALRIKDPSTHCTLENMRCTVRIFQVAGRHIVASIYKIKLLNADGLLMEHTITLFTEKIAVVFMSISCEGGWNINFDSHQLAKMFSSAKFAVENGGKLRFRHGGEFVAHLRLKLFKECLECGGCGQLMAQFR